jgi:hypothetical protein
VKERLSVAPRVVLGLAVMAVGLALTAQQLGLFPAKALLRFWPVAVIAYGLAHVLHTREVRREPGGYVWMAFGTALLLDRLDVVSLWRFFWPAVLILAGASILRSGRSTPESSGDGGERLSGFAALGGVSRRSTSTDFRGGDFAAVMGGVELDLRGASIGEREAVIDVFAFWGGIEIKVPADWQVISRGWAILGGFVDNSTPNPEATKRLIVRGTAIMGGVEIKN